MTDAGRVHIVAVLTLALAAPCVARAADVEPTGRVLALYWGDSDDRVVREQEAGVHRVFERVPGGTIEYSHEYLETSRFPREGYVGGLREYLLAKYDGKKIDVILAFSSGALNFVLAQPESSFFPEAAIVFGTQQAPTGSARAGNITGVVYSAAIAQTVDLALRLQPDTKSVFVTSGTSEHDGRMERDARHELQKLQDKATFTYLTDLPITDLLARVKGLPEKSIILSLRQSEVGSAGTLRPLDVRRLVAAAASAPVYTVTSTSIGNGVIGGYVSSAEAVGARVAEMTVRVLNGTNARDIPVEPAALVPTFDWRQLQRWGVPESRLPANSTVLFRPVTFWERYRGPVIAAVIVFGLETLLIFGLVAQGKRRRKAERALRDSENRYRNVIETQTELICRFLPDTTLTFVNDACCRLWKKRPEELIGSKFTDLVPVFARGAVEQRIATLVQKPRIDTHEHQVLFADGSTGWQQWTNLPLVDADGRVRELQAVGRDITERKQTEEALQHSEARNTAILRAMPDLMFVLSKDGVYLDFHSRNASDLFVSPGRFLGKRITEVFPPALADMFLRAVERAPESGEPILVEYTLDLPGREMHCEARLVACERDKVLSVVRDVTERVRSEKALRENQMRYELATASGRVGVWDLDLLTDIMFVDPQLKMLLGYADSEIENRLEAWSDILHPADREATLAAVQACIQGRSPLFEMEHRFLHKDGSIRWFLTRGSPIRDEDGRVIRMIGTDTDLTTTKNAEEALRRSETALRASLKEVRDLAGRLIAAQEAERARIARDLHDDLSQELALLNIELERLGQNWPTSGQEIARRVREISERTGEISSTVHRLSYQLHPSKLQTLGLLAGIQSLCRDVSAQHHVGIEFRHVDVPAAVPSEIALCMFRIAQEALHNVVRHSRATKAHVSLEVRNGSLELHVADPGQGFVVNPDGSAGLGLISMRERAHFLGGQFVIHSAPGCGTRLGARVPLDRNALRDGVPQTTPAA
jgi:PAS domain S-box-containing protein